MNTSYLENPFPQQGWPIWQSFLEDSSNLVFQCSTCKTIYIYIGETDNSLSVRMYQHRHHIRKQNKSTVLYDHFKIHNLQNYTYMGNESNNSWSRPELLLFIHF